MEGNSTITKLIKLQIGEGIKFRLSGQSFGVVIQTVFQELCVEKKLFGTHSACKQHENAFWMSDCNRLRPLRVFASAVFWLCPREFTRNSDKLFELQTNQVIL